MYNINLMMINMSDGKCIKCGRDLDCHSICRCNECLMKERNWDARRRNGGWNPNDLSEEIEINDSPFGGEVKDENN